MSSAKTFILKIAFGGLGDHLFLSPLPRIAKQVGGFERVLISERSDFRHPAYRSLIWEANPFVDGFTTEDAMVPIIGAVPRSGNLLDALMLAYGLDDGKRFHEPELYFDPVSRSDLAGATVYDPNFVSYVGNVSGNDVEQYFEADGIRPDFMLRLREKNCAVNQYGQILETKDFEDYCSVIVSAKRFICLTSGGATLAAALRKPATCLWGSGQSPMFHHSKLHTYVNVHPNIGQMYLPKMYTWLESKAWNAKASIGRLRGRFFNGRFAQHA